jgi:tRNA threonylcarbamoyladenosine biosynthesis protein TsaB
MPKPEYNIEAFGPAVLILSLDTTTRGGSVALVRDGQVMLERAGDAALTHAQRLPAELIAACAEAGVEISDIELFAVAVGPGSFTGLRIGIATVQGLALARGRRVVPVSTLQALAAAAPDGPSRVAAWMDAHRGEVYAQVFEKLAAAEPPLSDPVAAPAGSVLALHASLVGGTAFHGDGALRYRDEITSVLGPSVTVITPVRPLAGAVGRIAARDPERAVLPHAIVPLYVRRPDVEIVRERRAGGA